MGNVVGATIKALSRGVGKWVATVVKVIGAHVCTSQEAGQ